jgi:hypothetical protein
VQKLGVFAELLQRNLLFLYLYLYCMDATPPLYRSVAFSNLSLIAVPLA